MFSNADRLLNLCKLFFKRATLENDMAKRVMLSIIPSLQEKSEFHLTKGFDYKTLKSAVYGAKDLVKYGTKACVGELDYYGKKYDPNDPDKLEECQEKYDIAMNIFNSGDYLKCLKLCTECFNDLPAWNDSFGGKNWAKISNTLYEIGLKKQSLDNIRKENMSEQRDPETDYLTLEIEAMKEIIVLMNVFDGLAHNTGNIMQKLLEEEAEEIDPEEYLDVNKEPDPNKKQKLIDENLKKREEKQEKLKQKEERVEQLMDAKELKDPFSVYKTIEDTINNDPSSKHMFSDWIGKARRTPDYKNVQPENTVKELSKIRTKKVIINKFKLLEEELDQLEISKNKITNSKNTNATEKAKTYIQIAKTFNELHVSLYSIKDYIEYSEKGIFKNRKSLAEYISSILTNIHINTKLINGFIMRFNWDYDKEDGDMIESDTEFPNEIELANDVGKIKRSISKLENVVMDDLAQ